MNHKTTAPDEPENLFLINECGEAFKETDLAEETVSSEVMFRGHVFTVEKNEVLLHDGTRAPREIVRHNGGAAILPLDEDGYVYMVRQYRCPFQKVLLEIPAGKMEPDEDPKLCAIRELKEETGLEACTVESLGYIYPTPGYCSEVLYLFLATDLWKGESCPDTGEFINVHRIPLRILLRMIHNGEISDAKTIVALLKAARRLGV
ncbi:MAG: NUDIX hydrolase [Clostridiaceae bacterium]|jgi:ADP-ribose pyrophosphatase|nr:NUDIX hydrolase [Clostridiaceae bacterium]